MGPTLGSQPVPVDLLGWRLLVSKHRSTLAESVKSHFGAWTLEMAFFVSLSGF